MIKIPVCDRFRPYIAYTRLNLVPVVLPSHLGPLSHVVEGAVWYGVGEGRGGGPSCLFHLFMCFR